MEEKWLRKWVKQTVFIDSETKQKLLNMDTWWEEVFQLVKKIFDKYAKKEIDILNYLIIVSNKAYIETINEIEQKQKKQEIDELITLEQELEKVG